MNDLPIKHIWLDLSDTIGDDVHKDLLPAKQVGIITGLLWKESPEADHCFKDFQAILDNLD